LESRPIWRAARENIFQTLNQVGGGLGDYVIQTAIDAEDPLMVIDGFGGSAGYDLDEIDDDAAGPIREKGSMR
jgi:hypothetical protein